jgi:hypothetical protein
VNTLAIIRAKISLCAGMASQKESALGNRICPTPLRLYYLVSGRKLVFLEVARSRENLRVARGGGFLARPRRNRQYSQRRRHRSCGNRPTFSVGGFKPPLAPSRLAPALGPATLARSRAGCSSSLRSPRTADSLAVRRPDTGSTHGVPGC